MNNIPKLCRFVLNVLRNKKAGTFISLSTIEVAVEERYTEEKKERLRSQVKYVLDGLVLNNKTRHIVKK